jgi:hypothetical protein
VVRNVFHGRVDEIRDTLMVLCYGLHKLLITQKQPLAH